MSFWSWLTGTPADVLPNDAPGDPDGVEYDATETFSRSLPVPVPGPWAGWPADWSTPLFNAAAGMQKLVDVAWCCIDKNASVLSAMPVYRVRSGKIVEPYTWMLQPDSLIYASWQEFCKEVFWQYQLGEVFILAMSRRSDGYPSSMRVVPSWAVNVEMVGGRRQYSIGKQNIPDGDILHVRYQSSVDDAHGHGPLESAGARITAAGLLQKYSQRLIETGGVPHYWVGVERRLTKAEADDLLNQWVESRTRRAGEPALLSGGAELRNLQSMSAKDMALVELSQFNESRIAVALGVPPFLVGLPSGGDSMTYANTSNLFDYHDRSSLRPMATAVMSALSNWAAPYGTSIELNRDEYSRPAMKERFEAYQIGIANGFMTAEEAREMERLHGEISAAQLTGGESPAQQSPMVSPAPAPSPTGGEPNVG